VTGFSRHSHELVCDGVPLSSIAGVEGTPTYVYSAAVLRERYQAIDNAFGDYPHRLHYALKANSTLAIVRQLRALGSAADANSIWEIDLARKAGFEPADLVFTGVGKSAAELEQAVPLGLKAINVESIGELARVEAIAVRLGIAARVALRVNPDIDAKSHPHISTGLKINKFGIPLEDVRELLSSMASRPSLTLVAVHVHVGSQMTTTEPLSRASAFVAGLVAELRAKGITLEYVDLGGGLGISYDGRDVPTARDYAAALLGGVRLTGLPLVIEPGRAVVGPAGVLLARVIDLKPRTADSQFAVLDAGMTELMRPALYGAYHGIEPVRLNGEASREYEFVGPVCESSDVVGRDRTAQNLRVGDLVSIADAGAYGSAMANNYNRRPLPTEVLVEDGAWRVIRRRQTLDDMTALEA
jgi:diaminopimelate decarboxylase